MNEKLEISCSAESGFLVELFKSLNEFQIRYAVMRNHETLPYSSDGSDLDILVMPEDAGKTRALLYQAVKKAGGVTIGQASTVGFLKVYALGKCVSHPKGWWGQCIDINVGLVFNGIPVLDNAGWIGLTRKHNDILVLSDGIAGVLGVLKEVLHNSKLPSRYFPLAKVAAEREWGLIKEVLKPIGSEALGKLHKLIISYSTGDDVIQQCNQIRSSLLVNAIRQHPFESLRQRFLCWYSKIQRYITPSGTVLAILGVDGAGKSTIIKAIMPVLEAATHNSTVIRHLRPGLLPPLSRFRGKSSASANPVLDPHGSIPSGVLGSFLRLTYLTLDYSLGYWLRIRPKIAKQPAIVTFDRYAYDMVLDPKRFRIGLPSWVAGLFAKFAPAPDLVICLHADPDIIAARKRELSVNETRRQVVALQAFAECQSNAVLITTDCSVDETREKVLVALFNFFVRRTRNGV